MVPCTVLGVGTWRVLLLAFGKRDKYLPLLHCPCCLLSHGKEPLISGSQKPWWLSQRDALGIQSLRWELQNWWGHTPAVPQESSVQKISCDLGLGSPDLMSFPKVVVSDPHVKEPTEETPWWAPSCSTPGGFPQGWGAAIWPCVFNSEVMWGMCWGFHVSVYVVGCAALKG